MSDCKHGKLEGPCYVCDLERANAKQREQIGHLLAHCKDAECMECSKIICEHGEPLHFHHDGCPACTIPCHCHDQRSRELCQDKDRCVRLVAFTEGGGGS